MDLITIILPPTRPRHATNAWEALMADDDGNLEGDTAIFTFDMKVAEGDLCDIYRGTYNGRPAALKVSHGVDVNDLVEHEADVIRHLFPAEEANAGFLRYLSKLSYSFHNEREGKRINVFPWLGEHVSVADILKAYPAGIEYQNMVWMFKRGLEGLGYVHEKNVLHGAVLPPHLLIHPADHGAKLIDWSYAVTNANTRRNKVRAMSAPWRSFYAPEILAKEIPTAATDIYMLAKCMVALQGGDVTTNAMPDTTPEPIQRFLRECLSPMQHLRPNNAWDLVEKFNEVLRRVIGPPKYFKFEMPPKV